LNNRQRKSESSLRKDYRIQIVPEANALEKERGQKIITIRAKIMGGERSYVET